MQSKLFAALVLVVAAFGGSSGLSAADSVPRGVRIKSGEGNQMKFDVATIAVAPGESIKVVLTNACTLPKNVMGHNWVLLAKGTDPVAFATAGMPEAEGGYIPAKMKDKVLAVIGMLGPNETGEVLFTAPTEPGEYPFLCCFPAHCQIGMKGVLVVKK